MADDRIDVKISASVDEFEKGLKGAIDNTSRFTDSLNQAAAKAQSVDPSKFKALATELNNGAISAETFGLRIAEINKASGAAAQGTTALTVATKATGEAAHVSAGSMRELVVVGREIASGNLTRLPGSLSILASRLGGIPPQAILAAAGIAAVGYAAYAAIDSSQQFEVELQKVQQALEAVGNGNSFDRTAITQYINDLRQIPDVNREAAGSIVEEFARSRNIGGDLMKELTAEVSSFAAMTGKEAPKAAQELAAAFNEPYEGAMKLDKAFGILSPDQRRMIEDMRAVNDIAGQQRVLFDALSTRLQAVGPEAVTPLTHYFHDLRLSIAGINEDAAKVRDSLLMEAAALEATGNAADIAEAKIKRHFAEGYQSRTRNLPPTTAGQATGAAGQAAPSADQNRQAVSGDVSDDLRQRNEAIKDGQELYEKGNSPLREQEKHVETITRLQKDLTAAQEAGAATDAQHIQAEIEQENKLYEARLKRDEPKEKSDRSAEAGIKADGEAADARIKTEQQVVDEKLKLGQISTEDARRQLEELAAQEHAINLRRIADMRAVYQQQGDKSGIASSNGQAEVEDQRYAQEKLSIDTRIREQEERTGQQRIEAEDKVGQSKIKTAEDAVQRQVALGTLSAQQEYDQLADLVRKELALEEQKFAALDALYKGDAAKQAEVTAQKLEAEQRAQQQLLQLQDKLTKQEDADRKKDQQEQQRMFQPMVTGFATAAQGVLTHETSLQQGLTSIGNRISNDFFTNVVEKRITNWLAGNAQIQSLETALSSFLGIENTTNAQASTSTASAAATENVSTYAAEGAAAATASTAAIPIVGPELAPAAGAAIYADIESYGIASAAGGMIVDGDQIARVHENEMVLPARYTSGLTSMIDRANAGTSGAGHTFNNTFHVNGAGVDAAKIPAMIDAHIQRQSRNGAYGSMRR